MRICDCLSDQFKREDCCCCCLCVVVFKALRSSVPLVFAKQRCTWWCSPSASWCLILKTIERRFCPSFELPARPPDLNSRVSTPWSACFTRDHQSCFLEPPLALRTWHLQHTGAETCCRDPVAEGLMPGNTDGKGRRCRRDPPQGSSKIYTWYIRIIPVVCLVAETNIPVPNTTTRAVLLLYCVLQYIQYIPPQETCMCYCRSCGSHPAT